MTVNTITVTQFYNPFDFKFHRIEQGTEKGKESTKMSNALLWAAAGTGFTFLMTTLGAALVFFFKKQSSEMVQKIFLGFAAGVMIAASVWSLLIPAIEEAEANGMIGWIPAAGGFLLGALFLMGLDSLLPHLHLSLIHI